MIKRIKLFRKSENGAVTVDWVVLTAVVAGFGAAMVLTLGGTADDGIADGAKARIQNVPVKLSD